MTQVVDNNLAQINLHNVMADSHSSKNSGKKVWEREFLSQQVRWSQSENLPPVGHDNKGAGSHESMSEEENYAGRNVDTGHADLCNQQPGFDRNQYRAKNNFPSERDILIKSEVPSVAQIGQHNSEIKPGGNRLLAEGKLIEMSAKVNVDDCFRTVLIGQAERPSFKNKKINRDYGGLAVYRGNRLYLWLRSKNPEFTRKLYKSMSELGIKLMRWVVNGHIIKS
jgi:hypothetical protein